jgi:hypothetical protein
VVTLCEREGRKKEKEMNGENDENIVKPERLTDGFPEFLLWKRCLSSFIIQKFWKGDCDHTASLADPEFLESMSATIQMQPHRCNHTDFL